MDVVLPVIGGLGLFLYGMTIMGTGLEKTAGNKLSRLIEVLTSNRLMAVLVGVLVTMAVQSSSATTVMVIGFVNANLMTLSQAVGVIMGANIGTTVTAQIIALNLTDYAPIAVAIGVVMLMAGKKKRTKSLGEVFVGFGILFIGMDMMGKGLEPLSSNPIFANIILKLENPILGALTGMLLTTVLQSSSASIGLLQALASQGLIGLNIAFPILFGENIGTTTTALISSIGASVAAKRAAVIHFLFNLIGTIIFMTVLRTPVEWLVLKISPTNTQAQIANAHTLFNILNVVIQFPFMNFLVRAAEFLVPDKEEGELEVSIYLDNRILETPSIALGQAIKETERMSNLVLENLRLAKNTLINEDYDAIEEGFEREELINTIEKEITQYLVLLSRGPLSDEQHISVNNLLYAINDIERIGDHVENILELSETGQKGNLKFSDDASKSLEEMFEMCELALSKSMEAFVGDDKELAQLVLEIEETVDDMEEAGRKDHIERLNKRLCLTEPGLLFLDTISNLERVSDHASNIARYVLDEEE